ncbi:hypothetical protein RHGRI_030993 [Rhododendron griersonianum]|uniref:Uncharacterized protein n=1 Tax=Rhododendron griersonianum TaxID=479676 RepID=A0AAV6I6H5_9ERIC|nr:hypothetical protein RHGRI_030993 [Rhododendron griersonianum]
MDTPVNSFNPNKHLKEQFVSNLTGSSMLEIIALATAVPVLILLRRCFCSNGMRDGNATKISSKKNDDVIVGLRSLRAYMAATLIDFLLIILPLLLFFTLKAIFTILHKLSGIKAKFQFHALSHRLKFTYFLENRCGAFIYLEDGVDSLRTNISSYRVSIMVVTCLCILAVDFRIFPRRYAKTDTYGTSLEYQQKSPEVGDRSPSRRRVAAVVCGVSVVAAFKERKPSQWVFNENPSRWVFTGNSSRWVAAALQQELPSRRG